MADQDDSVTGSPSAWADLPPELVALVLRRLPTLIDRVRLRAVCRPWQREPLPVPFPWLCLPNDTFVNVPDGKVHRFPALLDTATCHGSVGNWLLLFTYRTGRARLTLANPFDGAVVELAGVGVDVFKLVHLAAPSSPPTAGSLFAVLRTSPSEIFVCRAGAGTAVIAEVPDREVVDDVAFLDGKLYAMSYRQLYIFDIDAIASCDTDNGKPGTLPRKCIANLVDTRWTPEIVTIRNESYSCKYRSYLVVSGGRLLHIRRLIGYPPPPAWPMYEEKRARTLWFDVFEADLGARFCLPWRRINTLGGGQALFVGRYSKSVTASECGARENCIYFVRHHCWESSALDPLGDSGVFDMRNGRITRLLSAPLGKNLCVGHSAWFFQMEVL